MAIGQEALTVAGWLSDTFSGDADLMALVTAVHEDIDPSLADGYPFVRFSCTAPLPDTTVYPATPILSRGLWEILVTDKSDSLVTARSAYARVHQLIQAARDVARTTGTVLACLRRQPYPSLTEQVDGVVYRSTGGLYEIQAT